VVNCLTKIRHLVLDMDGTIYRGSTLFDWTLPFLARLRSLGIGTFVTNNSSRSVEDHLVKLHLVDQPRIAVCGEPPDRISPTDKPTILVDCGAICACLVAATDASRSCWENRTLACSTAFAATTACVQRN